MFRPITWRNLVQAHAVLLLVAALQVTLRHFGNMSRDQGRAGLKHARHAHVPITVASEQPTMLGMAAPTPSSMHSTHSAQKTIDDAMFLQLARLTRLDGHDRLAAKDADCHKLLPDYYRLVPSPVRAGHGLLHLLWDLFIQQAPPELRPRLQIALLQKLLTRRAQLAHARLHGAHVYQSDGYHHNHQLLHSTSKAATRPSATVRLAPPPVSPSFYIPQPKQHPAQAAAAQPHSQASIHTSQPAAATIPAQAAAQSAATAAGGAAEDPSRAEALAAGREALRAAVAASAAADRALRTATLMRAARTQLAISNLKGRSLAHHMRASALRHMGRHRGSSSRAAGSSFVRPAWGAPGRGLNGRRPSQQASSARHPAAAAAGEAVGAASSTALAKPPAQPAATAHPTAGQLLPDGSMPVVLSIPPMPTSSHMTTTLQLQPAGHTQSPAGIAAPPHLSPQPAVQSLTISTGAAGVQISIAWGTQQGPDGAGAQLPVTSAAIAAVSSPRPPAMPTAVAVLPASVPQGATVPGAASLHSPPTAPGAVQAPVKAVQVDTTTPAQLPPAAASVPVVPIHVQHSPVSTSAVQQGGPLLQHAQLLSAVFGPLNTPSLQVPSAAVSTQTGATAATPTASEPVPTAVEPATGVAPGMHAPMPPQAHEARVVVHIHGAQPAATAAAADQAPTTMPATLDTTNAGAEEIAVMQHAQAAVQASASAAAPALPAHSTSSPMSPAADVLQQGPPAVALKSDTPRLPTLPTRALAPITAPQSPMSTGTQPASQLPPGAIQEPLDGSPHAGEPQDEPGVSNPTEVSSPADPFSPVTPGTAVPASGSPPVAGPPAAPPADDFAVRTNPTFSFSGSLELAVDNPMYDHQWGVTSHFESRRSSLTGAAAHTVHMGQAPGQALGLSSTAAAGAAAAPVTAAAVQDHDGSSTGVLGVTSTQQQDGRAAQPNLIDHAQEVRDLLAESSLSSVSELGVMEQLMSTMESRDGVDPFAGPLAGAETAVSEQGSRGCSVAVVEGGHGEGKQGADSDPVGRQLGGASEDSTGVTTPRYPPGSHPLQPSSRSVTSTPIYKTVPSSNVSPVLGSSTAPASPATQRATSCYPSRALATSIKSPFSSPSRIPPAPRDTPTSPTTSTLSTASPSRIPTAPRDPSPMRGSALSAKLSLTPPIPTPSQPNSAQGPDMQLSLASTKKSVYARMVRMGSGPWFGKPPSQQGEVPGPKQSQQASSSRPQAAARPPVAGRMNISNTAHGSTNGRRGEAAARSKGQGPAAAATFAAPAAVAAAEAAATSIPVAAAGDMVVAVPTTAGTIVVTAREVRPPRV